MKYTINKTKRNLIIFSSAFLIVYSVFFTFIFFFTDPVTPEPLQVGIQSIVFLLAYSYLMLVFIDYFRFHGLKVLQVAALSLLVTEFVTRGFQLSNVLGYTIPKYMNLTFTLIWSISLFVSIVFLFLLKSKDYPAIRAIRWYAVCFILFPVLGATIPLLVKPNDIFITIQLLGLTLAIPYIFSIDFAVKVPLED